MVHQLVSLSDDLVVNIASTLSPAAYAQLRGCCSPLWHLLTPVRLIQQRGADTSTITTLEAVGYSGLLACFAAYTAVKAQEAREASTRAVVGELSGAELKESESPYSRGGSEEKQKLCT